MNMQAIFDKMIQDERGKTLLTSEQITLGKIISKVEAIISHRTKNQDPPDSIDDPDVIFEFADTYPTDLDSWRGSYNELAFGFSHGYGKEKPMPASEFLRVLKDALSYTFTGYKGGDNNMYEDTPVWVANYGNSGDTGVVDVVDDGYSVIIKTATCKY